MYQYSDYEEATLRPHNHDTAEFLADAVRGAI